MYSDGIIDQKRLEECRIKEENGEFVIDRRTKLVELKNLEVKKRYYPK